MKFGPKEIKELNEYLRTGRNRQREFLGGGVTFASDLAKPVDKFEVQQIDLFNQFNKRNPRADGGRIGFSEGTKPFEVARGKRKGLYAVRSRLNVDDVADAVDSSTDYIYFKNKTDADNFYNSLARRGSETYIGKENFIKERKKFPKLNIDEFAAKMNELGYTDAGGKKLDGEKIKQYHATFEVPLDKDAYKPKAPGAKKTRPSNDPQRLKEIDDYVKEFETEYGKKPTSKNIIDALQEQRRVIPIYEKTYNVTLPTGSGAKLTNVEKDINKILKNQKIIDKLDAGKFPTITDISRITGLDVALSETRLVDLAEKLRENPKYKTLADNYLNEPGITNLSEGFGGRKRKRSRTILENRFVKLMGLDKKLPSLRSEILRKIQSFIPELKGLLAVDEIAGITSSMRRGSGPYAIFGQVLGGNFNTQVKGHGIDKDKGNLEKKLINLAKDDPQRLVEQKLYNEKIKKFEADANKNNPAKKVRGLKLSFKPPSETVKNKKVYNQYKDLFDAHYEKYGYSFEVPADRDSLIDISKKLDDRSFQNTVKNRFKNLISKGGKVGVGVGLATLAGTGFALAGEEDALSKFSTGEKLAGAGAATATAGTLGTKTGRNILSKAFRTLGTPLSGSLLAANQIRSNIQSGENVADAVLDPLVGLELSFPGLFKENLAKITSNPTAQRILRLGKFGRALTPIGAGITAAGLGIDAAKFTKKRIDELRSMTPEQRTELRSQGARQAFDPFQAAGGGLAKQAGDRSGAMLESMNPDKDGLPGLLKRVKKQ